MNSDNIIRSHIPHFYRVSRRTFRPIHLEIKSPKIKITKAEIKKQGIRSTFLIFLEINIRRAIIKAKPKYKIILGQLQIKAPKKINLSWLKSKRFFFKIEKTIQKTKANPKAKVILIKKAVIFLPTSI